MKEVVIRINPRVVERTIYLSIIVILAVLLVLSYFNNDCGRQESASKEPIIQNESRGEVNTTVVESNGKEAVNSEPKPSCNDGKKNQDETDVDCGGVCKGCDEGGSCISDSDCLAGSCESQVCTVKKLSGDITTTISDVKTEKSPTSDAVKLVGFKITIDNGLDKAVFPEIKVFVKSKSGILLNQFTDEERPYIDIMELGKVSSGEKKTFSINRPGSYLPTQQGYDMGDNFKVLVEVYDDGKKIDEAVKPVTV